MIFIRVVLYLVCILSIGWSALVFAGPVIVKRLILGYTNGAIVPSDITISPALNIKISRLDFFTLNENFEIPFEGFLRAAQISWSLFDEKPFLSFTSGPTVLENFLSADHTHISTPSFKEINWQNLRLDARVEGPNHKSMGQAEAVSMNANFDLYSSELSNVELEVQSIIADINGSTYQSKLLSGQITDLNFHTPLDKQPYSGTFLLYDVMVSEPSLRSEFARVSIYMLPDTPNFEIDLKGLGILEFGGSVKNVKIHGNYDRDYNFNNLNLYLSGGTFMPPSFPNFSNISARIFKTGTDTYNALIEGALSEFEMSNSENFFGLLPPSNFEILLQSDETKSTLNSEAKINFTNLDVENINASALLILKSGILAGLDCFISNCYIPDFDLTYKINISDEVVTGRAECAIGSCGLADISHVIRLLIQLIFFQILTAVS